MAPLCPKPKPAGQPTGERIAMTPTPEQEPPELTQEDAERLIAEREAEIAERERKAALAAFGTERTNVERYVKDLRSGIKSAEKTFRRRGNDAVVLCLIAEVERTEDGPVIKSIYLEPSKPLASQIRMLQAAGLAVQDQLAKLPSPPEPEPHVAAIKAT